jgi:hypothetical protein
VECAAQGCAGDGLVFGMLGISELPVSKTKFIVWEDL